MLIDDKVKFNLLRSEKVKWHVKKCTAKNKYIFLNFFMSLQNKEGKEIMFNYKIRINYWYVINLISYLVCFVWQNWFLLVSPVLAENLTQHFFPLLMFSSCSASQSLSSCALTSCLYQNAFSVKLKPTHFSLWNKFVILMRLELLQNFAVKLIPYVPPFMVKWSTSFY